METDIQARVAALEKSNRRLRAFLLPTALVTTLLAALAIAGFAGPGSGGQVTADSLRVRELVVLDSLGTVRVRIGAHLPDAVIDGKPVHRGEDVSGILLYDDGGRERGRA